MFWTIGLALRTMLGFLNPDSEHMARYRSEEQLW